jgi:SNF2 family DNA or RNA helicase
LNVYQDINEIKKKYEENATICKLCQEAEPTCKVNCIHKNKSKEYLEKIGKLKFFRCSRCDISAHFDCMVQEIKKKTDFSTNAIVKYIKAEFICDRCICWNSGIQKILTYRNIGETEETKKREFLVKFKNTSYLHVDWVPEEWLKTINDQKYTLFMKKVKKDNSISSFYGRPPVWPKSEKDSINPEYCKVEMILDIEFFERSERNNFFNDEGKITNIIDFEKKLKRILIKWEGLPFSDITWEDYPDPEQNDIVDYRQALEYFLKIRAVAFMEPTTYDDIIRNDTYFVKKFKALTEQHPSIVGGKLKDYQIDGVNWLLYKWTKRESCILADEMGLGKTIQIISFLSILKEKYNNYPFLIIAPLSTLDNWYREFKKWAPDLIVVKYEGKKESRDIISQYLLYSNSVKLSGYSRKMINCHILITTPAIFRADHTLFKSIRPKWEVVVVDEGHCLKTENGRLGTTINELNIDFKVVLTGTPLQNNILELFNILSFLNPVQFHDAKNMQKEFETETINEEKLKKIRELLRPYMLRRSKSLVLKLPPKTETIVPVSMTSLQKRVYKGILEKNFNMLTSDMMKKTSFTSSSNVLMELKKCLNHPYLNKGIEPEFKDINEEHTHLIDACAKFQLLKIMLKKLKEQNHRVLIFSTMKILLDLLERFLDFEHYKYTRLDGETFNRERQQRIDAFNAPDSDIFIFLLSTRAGGQGINLASADTIIMYDHDWNPQADIQALSRAHRIGQNKLVAAYKLVTKDSAEERIIQVGNRKLALDHLIVNSLSKNRHPIKKDDMLSILRHGAKSLFEENEQESEQTLKWDEKSVEELLNRTRIPPIENSENKEEISDEFSFAKVWTIDKNNDQEEGHLENVERTAEETSDQGNQDEFWDNLLKKREEYHIQQLSEEYGVGKRKRTKAKYFYDELNKGSYMDTEESEKEGGKDRTKEKHKSNNNNEDSEDSYETCYYSSDDYYSYLNENNNSSNSIENIQKFKNNNGSSNANLNTININNSNLIPESTMKSLLANSYVPDHILSKGEIMYINRSPCWLCLQDYHPVYLCPSVKDRSLIYSRYKEIIQQPVRSYIQAIQLQILEFYLNVGANNSRVFIKTEPMKPSFCIYCKAMPYHSRDSCPFIRSNPMQALELSERIHHLPYFRDEPKLCIDRTFLQYFNKNKPTIETTNNINTNTNNNANTNTSNTNINSNIVNDDKTMINDDNNNNTIINSNENNNISNINNTNTNDNSNSNKTTTTTMDIDIDFSKKINDAITLASSIDALEKKSLNPWERYINAIQSKKVSS